MYLKICLFIRNVYTFSNWYIGNVRLTLEGKTTIKIRLFKVLKNYVNIIIKLQIIYAYKYDLLYFFIDYLILIIPNRELLNVYIVKQCVRCYMFERTGCVGLVF